MTEPIADGAARPAAARLRPFVAGYGGYRLAGFPPGIHRGLPSPRMTFIVSFDGPVDIVAMPSGQRPDRFGAFVAGLHTAPVSIRHEGDQHGVCVDLTPFGTRVLLGMPAGELAGAVVPLDALLGSRGAELHERAEAATTWDARFDVLDDVLGAALGDAADPPAEVAWAWRRLLETGGAVEIGALAREVGWSRRHLGARFRAELGISPKAAARVIRFDRARTMLAQPVRRGLADVAATCGFYDQAHLTREWHDLAGCTPTTWLAEELPAVRDPEVPAAAR
jgi:AraC-like DNA-binding protein